MDITDQKNRVEIFCCYARKDQLLLVDLKNHLKLWERQSLITIWADTDITPGTNWEKEIARHVNSAHIILFLVSPDFLASDYCYSIEMQRAMERYEHGEVCVIPIILRSCAWEEAPFSKIQALPANAKPVVSSGWHIPDEAFTDVARGIRKVVDEVARKKDDISTEASLSKMPKDEHRQSQAPPLQLPRRAASFVNREIEQSWLLNTLEPGRVSTVCGPGGMGKTALVAEVLWKFAPGDAPPARFPDGILYHSFYRQPDVSLAMDQIARSLGEEPLPTPALAAQRALGKKRVLLVLDGAEKANNLKQLLEICGRSAIIVTSQKRGDAADPAYRLDLESLSMYEAARVIQAWGGKRAVDTTAATEICEHVGKLPLALRIAGSYLTQQEQEASEYLSWLRSEPFSALEQGKSQQESVPALLKRSVEGLSVQAQQILTAIGFLGMAPFDCTLIARAVGLPNETVDQALGELVNYSLADRKNMQYEVSHPLIHAYAHKMFLEREAPPVQHRFAEQVIQSTVAMLPDISTAYLLLPEQDFPHVLAGVELVEQYTLVSPPAAQLLVRIGWYFLEHRQFDRAEAMLEQARDVSRQALDHLSMMIALDNLGLLVQNQGGLVSNAEAYYQEALIVGEEKLGADHPYLGTVLDHLAQMQHEQGQLDEAKSLYQRALTIKEKGLGSEHMRTAATMTHLAQLYRGLGDYDQGQTLAQRALGICEKLDPVGEGTVQTLQTLAILFYEQDEFPRALESFQRAIQISEKALGPESPSTALALKNLADVYRDQGMYIQAKPLYERALAIFEKEFGYSHKFTIGILDGLAEACKALGENDQAKQLLGSIEDRKWYSRVQQFGLFGDDSMFY